MEIVANHPKTFIAALASLGFKGAHFKSKQIQPQSAPFSQAPKQTTRSAGLSSHTQLKQREWGASLHSPMLSDMSLIWSDKEQARL